MNVEQNKKEKTERSLLIVLGLVVAALLIVAILGFLFMNKPAEIIEGQAEGTTVRISGKLPGRVADFYVEEGDTVHAGDTLVHIHSSVAEAQLSQAEAMRNVAQAQNRKVDAGTRSQIIQAAHDLLQQATAAVTISRKTYERLENLYKEGVISEQKRDEARAAYDAAVAAQGAAESQYSLALAGAQSEDKQAANALVQAASGGVSQVNAVLEDSYLIAPCDGTIDQIYPEVGELVSMGSPIMSVLRLDDRWFTFNVREELLNDLKMGQEVTMMIPALGEREVSAKVYYIRDMGSYAVWHSTKSTGSWDSRTFEVRLRPTEPVSDLRPGMSIIYKK
jgi:HlyD family secretion protein